MKRLFLGLALLCTAAYAEKVPLAVYDIEPQGVSGAMAAIVTDVVRSELRFCGKYELIEKARMQEVLRLQGFQQTGCTEAECAAKLGKILNVKKMVVGGLGKMGESYRLSLRVVDVETAVIEAEGAEKQALKEDDLDRLVPSLVSRLFCPEIKRPEAAPPLAPPESAKGKNPVVTIETTLGTIVMELYPDKSPKTVENFVKLVKEGFYNGTLFHRIVPSFVVQGGDPLTKDPAKKGMWGSGGPGYSFADEPVKGDYIRGAVAMANAGPNTNGSQFFICVKGLTGKLGKKYNLFGQVTKGMDVVDNIVAVDRDERDCPKTNVEMKKVTVAEPAK